MQDNVEALKLKIEELNAEIEAFQAQLPEHGTQSIHRQGGFIVQCATCGILWKLQESGTLAQIRIRVEECYFPPLEIWIAGQMDQPSGTVNIP